MKQTKKNNKIRVLETTRKGLQTIMPFLCKEDAKFMVKHGIKSIMIVLQLLTIYLVQHMR